MSELLLTFCLSVLIHAVVAVHSLTYPRFEIADGNSTLYNNSFIIRGRIGEGAHSLKCVTDYVGCCTDPDVGNWTDQLGQPVQQGASGSDSLYVTRGPGEVSLNRRTGGASGMWRCDIPDSNGTIQSLYIYTGTAKKDSGRIRRVKVSFTKLHTKPNVNPPIFTLTCQSWGGPATYVTWRRNGVVVQEDRNHETNQIILDTTSNTIYSNTLKVSGREDGNYFCAVNNSKDIFPNSSNVVIAGEPTDLVAELHSPSTEMFVKWKSPGAPASGYILYLQYGCDDMQLMSVEFHIPGRDNTTSILNVTKYQHTTFYNISIIAVSEHLPSLEVGSITEVLAIAAAHNQTYPRFEIADRNGVNSTLFNNSFVIRGHIGEGVHSLKCVTDYVGCCTDPDVGNWTDQLGQPVQQGANGSNSLYVTRGPGEVSLNRRTGGASGMWRCDIPDSNGTLQSLYIYIGTAEKELNFTDGIYNCVTQTTVSPSSVFSSSLLRSSCSEDAATVIEVKIIVIVGVSVLTFSVVVVAAVLAILLWKKYWHNTSIKTQTEISLSDITEDSKVGGLVDGEDSHETQDERSEHSINVVIEDGSIEDKGIGNGETRESSDTISLEDNQEEADALETTEENSEEESEESESGESGVDSDIFSIDLENADIPVSEFPDYVEEIQKNGNRKFDAECKVIGHMSVPAHKVASLPHNRKHNRFINILPYDSTRVHLEADPDEEGSDYINACFIDGYGDKKHAYIAAQGPLKQSVERFWQMVWENKAPTIVMLTKCQEDEKNKCAQYWPEAVHDTMTTEEEKFQIIYSCCMTYADFECRKFIVKNLSKPNVQSVLVTQLHFTSWPDHGMPSNLMSIVRFIRYMRKLHPVTFSQPLVVHCSAGVGRTGTLITLDMMMQQMKAKGTINVYNCVTELRLQRMMMVQTKLQYTFIHHVLSELVVCGETEVAVCDLGIKFNKLQRITLDGTTGFQQHFKILEQLSLCVEASYSDAEAEYNKCKNRDSSILPNNTSRVELTKGQLQGSDYINASYVDGYKKKGAYLATQAPLENTVADVWRMVWEKQSSCIVLLCQLEEDELTSRVESCHCFWPIGSGGESAVYGNLRVTLNKASNYDGGIVVRELGIKETNSTSETPPSLSVILIQLMSWPKQGLPHSSSIISVSKKLTEAQVKLPSEHTVIMCSDGSSRTGTFICIQTQVKQVKNEGVVDIFQAIRSARMQRAGFIPNAEHYAFCYGVVKDYVCKEM